MLVSRHRIGRYLPGVVHQGPDPAAVAVCREVLAESGAECVILHGSRGWGGWDEQSDLNVIVIHHAAGDEVERDRLCGEAVRVKERLYRDSSDYKADLESGPDIVTPVDYAALIMPKKDGVEACREIMESATETRVVMLTASTEVYAIVEAVAAGATGYLQKETDRERLLSTARDAVSGELRVPVEVVRRAFEEIRGGGRAGDAAAVLTQREREILVSVSQGMSYARIAEARGIKPVTARNAIYGIQQKLGVGSMQELVLWSVRNGLLGD